LPFCPSFGFRKTPKRQKDEEFIRKERKERKEKYFGLNHYLTFFVYALIVLFAVKFRSFNTMASLQFLTGY